MCDRLDVIDPKFWPELRDKFLIHWPNNFLGYATTNNFMKWRAKDPSNKGFSFYSLNGDWSDGTFIVLDGRHLFSFTLNSNTERLGRLLALLPSNRSYMVCGIESHLEETVCRVIEEQNWMFTLVPSQAYVYSMSQKKALQLEIIIPDGLTLKPLNAKNIVEIDSVYVYQDDYTLGGFMDMQRFNLNLGLFDENDNLLAWCLQYQSRMLTALQVQEHAKRRGLASVIVKAMARKLAMIGEDCVAAIVTTNTASLNLFQKLGFEYAGFNATWIIFST